MTSILIIDDDTQLLEVLSDMLRQAGYETNTATDGDEGISRYRASPADLVLIDILMPGKEGIETEIELKREFPDIRIIAMSGGGRTPPQRYLDAASQFGACAVLTKPITRKMLLDTVAKWIDG